MRGSGGCAKRLLVSRRHTEHKRRLTDRDAGPSPRGDGHLARLALGCLRQVASRPGLRASTTFRERRATPQSPWQCGVLGHIADPVPEEWTVGRGPAPRILEVTAKAIGTHRPESRTPIDLCRRVHSEAADCEEVRGEEGSGETLEPFPNLRKLVPDPGKSEPD